MDAITNGFTVKSHFESKEPAVLQIYDRVLKAAESSGR